MRRSFALAALVCGALHAETVLVLPFFNQSSTQNLDWIGESIAESLNDTLAYQGLLVLNREDRLEAYRRLALRPGAELTHASVLKIGQALDASSVIYGYYEKTPASTAAAANSSLRVTVRIVDLKRLRPLAEFTEIRSLEDLAALEAHLGWQALQRLTPKDAPGEQAFMQARPPVRLDAVESYVRGLLAQTPEQRQRFFMQSARLDEHYSPPRYQLGMAFWANKDYPNAGTWLAKVDRANPHYLEAQFFLGLCSYYGGDFAGAEHSFQLVAASVPLNEVFNDLGAAQDRRNNTEGAAASFQKALEGDSADPDYHFNLGYTLWKAGKFPEAVASFRAVLERNPGDTEATSFLGRALKKDGPRPGDPKSEARERLKTNYEEDAYRQLQAELKPKK